MNVPTSVIRMPNWCKAFFIRPSKQLANIHDVKRYLRVAIITRDGLLVIWCDEPLTPSRECIIIPRSVMEGLITALHLHICQPSCLQLKLITYRYFYVRGMDSSIERVTASCHICTALQSIPHTVIRQSSSDPPEVVHVWLMLSSMSTNSF